jgi:hypothetical protein
MSRAGPLGRSSGRGLLAFCLGAGAVALATGIHCGPGRFEGITGGKKSAGSDGGDSGDGGDPVEQCSKRCEAQYPDGVRLDDAVEKCINQACNASCGTGNSAKIAEELDGGALATCPSDVETESEACDQCIRFHCCTPWTICYGDAGFDTPTSECELLDRCYEGCGVE